MQTSLFKQTILSTTFSKIWLSVGPIFTVLPTTSLFLVCFRSIKYRIEALNVLYPTVGRWLAKSCFWFGQSLGQTWSTLVKLGQPSPNLKKHAPGRVLRVLKRGRTPLKPSLLYPGCLVLHVNT